MNIIQLLSEVKTPYITILTQNSRWWNNTTEEFESYNVSNWSDYVISATQYEGSNVWYTAFPTTVPPGRYDVIQYGISGVNAANTDITDANGTLDWNGTDLDSPPRESVVIPPSDPGFVTGYSHCYDEKGKFAVGVTVQLQMTSLPNAGLSFSTNIRSEISDENGIVSFTNLVPGATYNLRRGITTVWTSVTIDEDAEDPVALDALLGHDACS